MFSLAESWHLQIRPISKFAAEDGVLWLYDGLIPRDAFGLLMGESGLGKTTLAVDLAVATATCTPFGGAPYVDSQDWDYRTHEGTRRSGVLYIYGEGGPSIDTRMAAAYEARKAVYGHVGEYVFDHEDYSDLPIRLWQLSCTPDGPTSLRSTVDDFIRGGVRHQIEQEIGASIRLVIVDTLMAVAGVSNENDNAIMQDRANALKLLGSTLGATVVVITHTKKGTGDMRGASSTPNTSDFSFRVAKRPASDLLVMEDQKARHGPRNAPVSFRLAPGANLALVSGTQSPPRVVRWHCKGLSSRSKPIEGPHASLSNDVGGKKNSGLDVYMRAAKIVAARDGAVLNGWIDVGQVRAEFDRMYNRNHHANRKAFVRAQNLAVASGALAVSTADGGRRMIRFFD